MACLTVAVHSEPAETGGGIPGRWSAEKANAWYDSQPWPCGFNYIPANAISYTEMWMGIIEIAGMMLDYYETSGDSAFRDDTLIPMAAETFRFYDRHWQGDDGARLGHARFKAPFFVKGFNYVRHRP